MTASLRDNPSEPFELEIDGEVAYADYRRQPGTLVIAYVYAPPAPARHRRRRPADAGRGGCRPAEGARSGRSAATRPRGCGGTASMAIW